MDPITLGAGLFALGTTAYNVYQNYQTKKREDNAAQRRVADLRAAGLSPTLAAGSPAATSDYGLHGEQNPFGSALDAKIASNQIKQQEYETSILKSQAQVAKYQVEESRRNNAYGYNKFMYDMGFIPGQFKGDFDNGYASSWTLSDGSSPNANGWINPDWSNSPFIQALKRGYEADALNLENLGYDTAMNRKANTWYNFNQGFNAVNQGLGTIFNGVSTFGSLGMGRARMNLLKTEQGLRYSPFNESIEYYDAHGRYRGTRRKYSNR